MADPGFPSGTRGSPPNFPETEAYGGVGRPSDHPNPELFLAPKFLHFHNSPETLAELEKQDWQAKLHGQILDVSLTMVVIFWS